MRAAVPCAPPGSGTGIIILKFNKEIHACEFNKDGKLIIKYSLNDLRGSGY